jgi:hypothetical protein
MAGTIATAGLYSRLSHKADKLQKGGKLDSLPTVSFNYIKNGLQVDVSDSIGPADNLAGFLNL